MGMLKNTADAGAKANLEKLQDFAEFCPKSIIGQYFFKNNNGRNVTYNGAKLSWMITDLFDQNGGIILGRHVV